MHSSKSATPSKVAKQFSNINSYVPYVPVSVSSNLVAAGPLAKKLANIVSETSPVLTKTSLDDFIVIQSKKIELRSKVDDTNAQ